MDHGAALFTRGGIPRFVSKLFLNPIERQDLGRLYYFLHLVRDFATSEEQSQRKLNDLVAAWHQFSEAPMRELDIEPGDETAVAATKRLARLKILYGFDVAWVDELLIAMLTASQPHVFESFDESFQFARSIADGIGNMVASILYLPRVAHDGAAAQALAMLWLQFIHDVGVGGTADYFAKHDLVRCNLADLDEETARQNPNDFAEFMQLQLGRYNDWQREATNSWVDLTRRQRALLHAAVDYNNGIARRIARDPLIIFDSNLRPQSRQVAWAAIGHVFD